MLFIERDAGERFKKAADTTWEIERGKRFAVRSHMARVRDSCTPRKNASGEIWEEWEVWHMGKNG